MSASDAWRLALCAAVCSSGCDEGGARSGLPESAPWFEEVSDAWGLRFRHDSGHEPGRYLMPESVAGGAAVFDADGDGRLDVYFVQSGSLVSGERGANRLFLNRGAGVEPRFEDATGGSGTGHGGYGMGVACGDYDGDGDVDLYVTNLGPNVLLRNEGGGRFVDVTGEAGVGHAGWGTSAAFLDYDADGRLDLYVANYLEWSVEGEIPCKNELGQPDYCSPQNYSMPALDVLYHNEGNGLFRDVSVESGISSEPGTGLGVACFDFDEDGRLDVFVANDGMPNFLWRNLGDGKFENVAPRAGCAIDQSGISKAGMGVAIADVDVDGDMDLLVCNLNEQSDSLYLNDRGLFEDRTRRAGLGTISRPFTRFGIGWVDFDADGWLDLYQANGRVNMQSERWSEDPFAEPNLLFRGGPGPRFEEVLPRGGVSSPLVATSRAAAFGDLDDDGAVDVVVANRDGQAHVLRNVAPRPGAWIGFRLVDEHGSDALHARLSVEVAGRTIVREVRISGSYLASSDPRIVIGLAAAPGAQEILVRWPDGERERFGARPAGEYHELRRVSGSATGSGSR